MPRKSILFGACLVFLMMCGSHATAKTVEKFHETYYVMPDTKVELYNTDGNVTIRQWSEAYIQILAEKRTQLGGRLDSVKIDATLADDVFTVRTNELAWNSRVTVTYDIHVPEDVLISYIYTADGDVELEGTQGNTLIKTTDGKISVRRIRGNIEVTTTDGHVVIQDVTGNVKVNTNDGKIVVNHVRGYVDAKTDDGNIEIAGASGLIRAEASDANITAEIPCTQDLDAEIETDDGSIKIFLSPELNVNLEMKASDGDITLHNFEIVATELSENSIAGKVGHGGRCISVKTSDGDIDLFKLDNEGGHI